MWEMIISPAAQPAWEAAVGAFPLFQGVLPGNFPGSPGHCRTLIPAGKIFRPNTI